MRNLPKPGVQATATGRTQHEFYTAKDFPVLVNYTNKQATTHRAFPISLPFFAYASNEATVAQGYSVELNNMHGSPRAMRVFDEAGNLVSAQEYYFRTDPDDPRRLNNVAQVIDPVRGTPEQRLLGVDYDLIADAREYFSETHGPEVQINFDGTWYGPIFVPLPLPYPSFSTSFNRFRSLVLTKVITRSGILDSVVVWKSGSRITSKNLARDGFTGEVVLTETETEYGGFEYGTKIPGHWVYPDGMGMGFHNTGLKRVERLNNGIVGISSPIFQSLVMGDELMVERLDSHIFITTTWPPSTTLGPLKLSPDRAWVLSDVPGTGKVIVDEKGNRLPTGVYALKIIRSGRRNMQSLFAGQLLTTQNPLGADGLRFANVLDAAAIEYNNYWQTYAGFERSTPVDTCTCVTLEKALLHTDTFTKKLLTGPDLLAGRLDLSSIPDVLSTAIGSGVPKYSTQVDGTGLFITFTGSSGQCDFTVQRTDGKPFPLRPLNISGGLPRPILGSTSCTDSYTFLIKASYQDQDHPAGVTIDLKVSSSCIKILDCTEKPAGRSQITCTGGPGAVVNPWLNGILGNWRPAATYKYVTNRRASDNPQERGVYEDFAPFWAFPTGFRISPAPNRSLWQNASKSTIIDPFGKVLESKDPLGIYFSELYGFNHSLVTAVAANARYNSVAFDGFEDYYYKNFSDTSFVGACPLPPHFKGGANFIPNLDFTQSHSGMVSLRVRNTPLDVVRASIRSCDTDRVRWTPAAQYVVQDCDLIKPFAPLPGKYVLSVWTKEQTASLTERYLSPTVAVEIVPASGPAIVRNFSTAGPIIEGWQLVNDTLVIPTGARSIKVSFRAQGAPCLFDDFRLQPFESAMQSFSYHPRHIRQMAALDENNYASFYEYDSEGLLARTKKETEQGIVTLKEIRDSKPKKQ
ncbi:MAG: hypothetical protein JNJ90_19970 [Saprospiraceae bacterium]|nr:hypothetical protein [Saprospiraceae bacterium]